MKNLIISILVMTLLISFGCKKDGGSGSGDNPSNLDIGTLTATIDGEDFESTISLSLIHI